MPRLHLRLKGFITYDLCPKEGNFHLCTLPHGNILKYYVSLFTLSYYGFVVDKLTNANSNIAKMKKLSNLRWSDLSNLDKVSWLPTGRVAIKNARQAPIFAG